MSLHSSALGADSNRSLNNLDKSNEEYVELVGKIKLLKVDESDKGAESEIDQIVVRDIG